MKVSVFLRYQKTFGLGLESVEVIRCEGVENPQYREALEGKIREIYNEHDTHGIREVDDSPSAEQDMKLLSSFLQDSCGLLCRAHFKP